MSIRGGHSKNRGNWRAISGGLLFLMLAVTSARTEDYQILRIDGRGVSWRLPDSGPLHLTYALVSSEAAFDGAGNCGQMRPFHDLLAASGLTAQDLTNAIEQAFARWQRVINVSFVPAAATETPQIVLGAQAAPIGTAFTSLRLAPGDGSTNPHIVGGAICLNPQRRWKVGFDGNLSSFDLAYIFTHEIGHILGLDHPGARGHVMSFRYLESNGALSDGDIAGAAALYGPRLRAHVTPTRRSTRLGRPVTEAKTGPQ